MMRPKTTLSVAVALAALLDPSLAATSNSSATSYPSLPSTGSGTLHPYTPATGSKSFVTAKDGKLYLDGEDYTFASFNYPGLIGQNDYAANDTFRTFNGFARPVTRCYTLGVTSINVQNASAFIQGWDNSTGDWVYNEDKFVQLDTTLDQSRQWGVKFVLPVINQDYGSQDTNYAGNWADLIRLYYGLSDYNSTKSINFWTDPNMIEATKKLYTKVLSRNNTVNGIVYGEDNTFWAIETGNELNYNMTKGPGVTQAEQTRPPPGNWTNEIAQHIKSLAPNILVLDGSLSRANLTEDTWDPVALKSPYVDLYSQHYYDYYYPSSLDYHKMANDSNLVRSYGKTFVIGEYGFFPTTNYWREFISMAQENPVAGSMVWSLRAHNIAGGFDTHGEGNGIFSYHAPGWSPNVEADFDPRELFIIREIYKLSYNLVNSSVAPWPIPSSPNILPLNHTSNGTAYFPFQGAAWAEHYEVFQNSPGSDVWTQILNFQRDDVDAGMANWTVAGSANGSWAMRGVSVDQDPGDWSSVITV